MKSTIIVLAGLLAVTPALGQVAEWGQCGGIGYTGSKTCSSGNACVSQNPYYYQCLPGTSTATTSTKATTTAKVTTSTKAAPATTLTTSAKTSTTTPSTKASTSTASSSSSSSGTTYKASFTWYGSGDTFGSANCQTTTAACGFYTSPGYSAAASQNLFGVGPGAGAGPACGTCWALTGETDSSGASLSNAGTSIVVMINNLCPADGNPLCSQSSLTSTNQYGANVNFDLCSDSGAKEAFFGSDGEGLAVGTAVEVDCSKWNGSKIS